MSISSVVHILMDLSWEQVAIMSYLGEILTVLTDLACAEVV